MAGFFMNGERIPCSEGLLTSSWPCTLLSSGDFSTSSPLPTHISSSLDDLLDSSSSDSSSLSVELSSSTESTLASAG